MAKKIMNDARHAYMGHFPVPIVPLSAFVLLSFLIIVLCTACGSTQNTATSSAFQATVQTTDKAFTVQVTITPNHLGNNTFAVRFVSPQQVPPQNTQVTLQTTMLDMAMGTDSVMLQANSQGTYSGQGTLTMKGTWQIQVVIHTPDHTLHEGQFRARLA